MTTEIQWTRVNSDCNGNPRFVCHFLELLTEKERADYSTPIPTRYAIACARANRIGGRKFHNKQFGGGIVFQSYCLQELESAIAEMLAQASMPPIKLRRTEIEVGTGKPGYRWVPAYIVTRPDGVEEFPPVQRAAALARAREIDPHAQVQFVD